MLLKIIAIFILTVFLSSCTSPVNQNAEGNFKNSGTIFDILTGLNSSETEMRGMWISFLDLKEPLKKENKEEFSDEIEKIYDNCISMGINTVFVHVRPYGDSIYPSEFFNMSSFCNPNAEYDALKIMTKKAKEKKLSFHAWINPMRTVATEEIKDISKEYPIRQWYDDSLLKARNLFEYEGRVYLNPASDEVRNLITDGVKEILKKYDVDGIHIDDYFYPPLLPASYDEAYYNDYLANGGDKSLKAWRQENTTKMVKELYDTVKGKRKKLIFSISPTGNTYYNEHNIYADIKTWCTEHGYCDYIIPQLYYGFENEVLDYITALNEWNEFVNHDNVNLVIGLAAYKVGAEDKNSGSGINEWKVNDDVLSRQVKALKEYENVNGVVFFRYDSLFYEANPAKKYIESEIERISALFD